ncbi:glycosyltransferase family 4 protein [Leucobacter japonicus]|uniref:glycosyltransferase family 4 protein n=1 Tax=Leucobacter japonicus TaxID=1461259 RepID=UPI0006A759E5|nr:glycosyltransferase family 4 protein [Leucobacter japonicus]
MKVVLFSHSARPSGAELFMVRVAEQMTGSTVLVVLGEHGPLESMLTERGIETLVVPLAGRVSAYRAGSRVALGAPAAAVGAARRLAAELRRRDVDVLYTHSAKAHLIGGLAGRLAGVPVVAHAHDLMGAPARGMLDALVQRIGMAVLPLRRIANSEVTRRSAGWAAGLDWRVIPCPVAVPQLYRHADPVYDDSPPIRLVVLGRLAEWKGQMLAIEAVARLVASGRDVTLDIVGAAQFADDETYARQLEAHSAKLGITDRVRFVGHLDDPFAAMRASHIVLHTSLRPEPFGQVIVEAISCGRPVVVADTAGAVDELEPGVDCVVYPMGDAVALADELAELVDDASLRRRIGRAAMIRARRFSADIVIPEIEAVLREASASARPLPITAA